MNNQLKHRVFDVPKEILDFIEHVLKLLQNNPVSGTNRAKNLIYHKKVTYGQLKRIIHDLDAMDPEKENLKYNLAGGVMMHHWAKRFLDNERKLISDRKKSRKNADEIGGISGMRQNSYLQNHQKEDNYNVSGNAIKSNSDKTSVSPIITNSLFEQINKTKRLIYYGT